MELDTVRMLRFVPMFRDLSDEELQGIGNVAILRTYDRKSVVFHEGARKEAVFFVKEGLVKTFKTDENGHEHIVSLLKPGEMFPHAGLFHSETYPATAVAVVETRLIAVPVHSFEQQLIRFPSVAMKMLRVMEEKIAELQGKLQELTGHDVQDRGLAFLLKLAEHYGTRKEGEVHIEIPMTHQDIASVIGTTRETVNRLLNQLRKEGILETTRSGLIIYDLEGLRQWRGR